jgi:hypothetical protein
MEQRIQCARPFTFIPLLLTAQDSDIIHLNLAGQSVIVLSSLEATEALLEKRSALYSDRRVFRTRIWCLWIVILFQIGSSYGEWVDGLGFQYWYAPFFLLVFAVEVGCALALMKYGMDPTSN